MRCTPLQITALAFGALLLLPCPVQAQTTSPPSVEGIPAIKPPDPLLVGKQALAHADYAAAEQFFTAFLKDAPDNAEALFDAGVAAFYLKHYDAAGRDFSAAIAKNPSMWQAHKNLVMVDAAQGKWQDFDAERELIQKARDTGAIGSKDNDVIELLFVGPEENREQYIVRFYPELAGRFKSRYNFTHFGKDGKLDFWISCESDDIDQLGFAKQHPKEAAAGQRSFSLDSYSDRYNPAGQRIGQVHGTIKFYPEGEPTYETVRADVIKVLEHRTGPMSTSTTPITPAPAPR